MSEPRNWTELLFEDASTSHPDIESILDHGYEQLDGFVTWSERQLSLPTRLAQQDCFNAETLIDYLANYQRKSASDVNEYELRWFLFSHYIRKASADPESEERLPLSLRNFYTYLQTIENFVAEPWLWGTLDDQPYFSKRRREYSELDAEDERAWEEGFRLWCADLEDDMDSRALSIPRDLGHTLEWGDAMGWREATLWDEANRTWQRQRSELLSDGLDYESVRVRLLNAYYTWVDMPQARLEDKTPAEVILEERQSTVDEAD